MGLLGDIFGGIPIVGSIAKGADEVLGRPGDIVNDPAKYFGSAAGAAAPFLGGPLAGMLGTGGAIPGWAAALMGTGGAALAGDNPLTGLLNTTGFGGLGGGNTQNQLMQLLLWSEILKQPGGLGSLFAAPSDKGHFDTASKIAATPTAVPGMGLLQGYAQTGGVDPALITSILGSNGIPGTTQTSTQAQTTAPAGGSLLPKNLNSLSDIWSAITGGGSKPATTGQQTSTQGQTVAQPGAQGMSGYDPYALLPHEQEQLNQQMDALNKQRTAAVGDQLNQLTKRGMDPVTARLVAQKLNQNYDAAASKLNTGFMEQVRANRQQTFQNLAPMFQGLSQLGQSQEQQKFGEQIGLGQEYAGLSNVQQSNLRTLLGLAMGLGQGGRMPGQMQQPAGMAPTMAGGNATNSTLASLFGQIPGNPYTTSDVSGYINQQNQQFPWSEQPGPGYTTSDIPTDMASTFGLTGGVPFANTTPNLASNFSGLTSLLF